LYGELVVAEAQQGFTSRAAAIAIASSLALHLALLLGLPSLHWLRPSPPLPIEVLPMKKHVAAPPMVDPGPPESTAHPKRPPGPGPRPPAPPHPPAPPVEDLRNIGPSTANVTIILRCSLLAKSPHRDGVETLLSALPDYHTLLDGTDLRLFDDLDALLIATPDPRDVTVTFLAARYHDPRVRALAQRRLSEGDPRQFRALGDELLLLGQPADLARIAAAEQTDAPRTPEEREAARWLEAIRRFDAGAPSAALLLTIADLPELVRLRDRSLPLPRTVRLSATAAASPAVRVVLVFDDEAQARALEAAWPQLRSQLSDLAPMFAGALDGLRLERQDRQLELAGTFPELQLRLAFGLVRVLIPHPPRPATPLSPPTGPSTGDDPQ
jgi:hypothetical protein